MHGTSGRLLKLLSLLQTRRDWPGPELADRLDVSPPTIRRDVDRLRYPVEASSGPFGGYRLQAGTAMPPLLLDDDEAVAIAVGLRTAAGASATGIEETAIRAVVKLEQVLPSRLRRRVNALQSMTSKLPATGPLVDPRALTTIAGRPRPRASALRLQGARRGREPPARRAAQPRRPRPPLVTSSQWDCDRGDWRTFRVDRIERLSLAAARSRPGRCPAERTRPRSSRASRRTATTRASRSTRRLRRSPSACRGCGGA